MRRSLLCLTLTCAWTTAFAQESLAIYKNFRHPPPGQYTQTLTGVVNGRPGPPQTQSMCTTGTADPRMLAAANQMAAVSGCTTRVLADTERLAESEQTCKVGDRTQTMRTTTRFVDDRTFTVDTALKVPGLPDTTTHSTVVYEGACTAATKAASEPSAADCAELRASLSESSEAAALCAQVPASTQAQCRAQVAAGRRMAEVAVARCG